MRSRPRQCSSPGSQIASTIPRDHPNSCEASRSPSRGSSADRPGGGAAAQEELPGQAVLNLLGGEGGISASVDRPPGAKVELILAAIAALWRDRGRIAPGFTARDHAEPMSQ